MPTVSLENRYLSVMQDHLVGIAPLVVGIVVVAVLIAAVTLGLRRRNKDPLPDKDQRLPRAGAWQTREEYEEGRPRAADHGPGHQEGELHEYETQRREPDPIPRDGIRRLPHALKGFGNEGTREAGSSRNVWAPKDHEN